MQNCDKLESMLISTSVLRRDPALHVSMMHAILGKYLIQSIKESTEGHSQ
jgi:hypothetical protein